ncbi:hypothetical protein OG777_07965 [Micromonospora peucetia]|uniref:PH domain-containing protein n=2 Tax=Micromonospora peucetia TaxID=47871 RepID=A0ABZ1EH55_9ACTN|nr:hypothetical protein [Micromonospora peucetia]MCX4386862.1 hypothetical protein [Micromonospora peucetia]WSA34179.1 hypothetical protein OIE14_09125 [Micromonospora peucetia]
MREMIDRALRRQRIAAAVAVAAGLLWGLAARRVESAGAVALLTLVPILVLLWAMLRAFGRPGTGEFRVDEREHAFFVPPTGRTSYRWIVLAFAIYTTTNQLASDREGLWWLYPSLTGPLAVVLAVALWRRVPSVALTPTGISAGDPLRHLWVPWEALDPAGPGGSYRQSGHLRLPVRNRNLVRQRGIASRRHTVVETSELDVTPELLAGAIRHYATHPEHRAAIGTPQEHARLRTALAGDG